ncbi:hypothetical protein CHUAL_005449 [Chamberlinius hualienensis]
MENWASPTGAGYGRGYGGYDGYGYGGGNVDGHVHGADKHKVHGQQYDDYGHNNHGRAYGDNQKYNDYYRGHHDKHKDFSNRNRALVNANRNRQAGDSYHNKGKVDDGFHNVYHKEEFSKSNRFYDTDRDNKLRQSFNDYDNYYDDVDGRYYDDAGHQQDSLRATGKQGNHYGQQHYDNGQAQYAAKNYGKDHQGYDNDYVNAYGGSNSDGGGYYY